MRRYIDENDKKNEIRLLFKHPSYKNKIILVVEGNSDYKLFRKLIKHDQIKIESIDGKKDLVKVMKDLSIEFPERILGICDADYDHLMNKADERIEYSVYVTDEHDIEIMMLLSPAIQSFIEEFSSKDNIDKLRNKILQAAINVSSFIGIVRWINAENHFNLNFKGLNYSEFIIANQVEISIDENNFIEILLNRSPKLLPHVDKNLLYGLINEYKDRSGSPYQICCGHDLTNTIAICYRQKWASVETNMTFKKIETALRLAYQESYFYPTDLFKNLLGKLNSFNIKLDIIKGLEKDETQTVVA